MWLKSTRAPRAAKRRLYHINVTDMSGTEEKDFFLNPLRAQLNTGSHKVCSYYACRADTGEYVFVKGPYASANEAGLQTIVQDFKSTLLPELPRITYEVIKMKMTPGFLNTTYGKRMSYTDTSVPTYFLVSEDLLQKQYFASHPDATSLPILMRKPTAKWTPPDGEVGIPVVDFAHPDIVPLMRHAFYDQLYEKSMFTLCSSHVLNTWILHLLISWAIGCGADLAGRNFLILNNKTMYQIDLEFFCEFEWYLTDTWAASMISFANKHMMRYMQSVHVQNFVVEKMKQALENFESSGRDKFIREYRGDPLDCDEIERRLRMMSTIDGIFEAIQLVKSDSASSRKKMKA